MNSFTLPSGQRDKKLGQFVWPVSGGNIAGGAVEARLPHPQPSVQAHCPDSDDTISASELLTFGPYFPRGFDYAD